MEITLSMERVISIKHYGLRVLFWPSEWQNISSETLLSNFFFFFFFYSEDPDPWFFSVCVQHNVLLANEKNFHMRFFYLVTSQSCAAQKFGKIGYSNLGLQSWDFRFVKNFFSPSPKKKFFFVILIEN